MKLVCQRDRGHPFNPSRIFTYKKNVIKYNRETEYLPELDVSSTLSFNYFKYYKRFR